MSANLILAAILSQTPATYPDIEIGRANWMSFQRMETQLQLPNVPLIHKVQEILKSETCSLPGQRPLRFNFTVNYAVRFNQANQVDRILVEDMGCEMIEVLVGNMVTQMLRHGHFQLPADRDERWLSNSVNFNLDA